MNNLVRKNRLKQSIAEIVVGGGQKLFKGSVIDVRAILWMLFGSNFQYFQ
jgi:hypothetical protein